MQQRALSKWLISAPPLLYLIVFFAIPLLDRKASRGERSPAFSDLAVAGILFMGFLTLKAWDIGVHTTPGIDPSGDPVLARTIARAGRRRYHRRGQRQEDQPGPGSTQRDAIERGI